MRAITEFSNMYSWDAPHNNGKLEFHGFELFFSLFISFDMLFSIFFSPLQSHPFYSNDFGQTLFLFKLNDGQSFSQSISWTAEVILSIKLDIFNEVNFLQIS